MNNRMKKAVFAAFLCILVAGCNRNAGQENAASEAGAASKPQVAREPDIRARIKQIAAGDRTGIWSSVPAVCKGSRKQRAEIMWHFPDAGQERVVVSFVGAEGKEKTFANGQRTGLKATGPWLREGMGFIVRSASDRKELGRLTIGGRDCP